MKSTVVNSRMVIVFVIVLVFFVLYTRSGFRTADCSPQKEPVHEKPVYLRDIRQGEMGRKLDAELRKLLVTQTILLNEQRRRIGQQDCEVCLI